MSTRLSVIIVTWNGMQYLPECLQALYAQLPHDAELIIVDNGSTDDTLPWSRAHYPQAQLLALPHNLGFAGGVNAGLRSASSELLLLINNDAFLEPDCIAALLDAAQRYPKVGAFSMLLTFAHRPEVVASAGIVARSDGVALDLWTGRSVEELPEDVQPIMGASGGGVLLRRAMLEDIGLFEPWFFNYLEDVDLAWRALLHGWKTLLVPQARARHVYSATAGQGSPFKQRLLARNRLAALIRCWPTALLLRHLPRIMLYDGLAALYGLLHNAPAIAQGRAEALQALPLLLKQRTIIQAARISTEHEFAQWLIAAPMPWIIQQQQQQLNDMLRDRGKVTHDA